jgi:hypothetical protein
MLKVGDIKEGELLRCVEGRTAAVVDDKTGRLAFLPTFLTLGELGEAKKIKQTCGPGHSGIMMFLGKARDKRGHPWYEMLWNKSVLRVRGVHMKYLEKVRSN